MERMDGMSAAFAESGHLLMRMDPFSLVGEWRHHALGMLQAELTERLRIHVWHPKLVRLPQGVDQPRCIHDHRFDLTSYVVAGSVRDVPVRVSTEGFVDADFDGPVMGRTWRPTGLWEIRHAKIQTHDSSDYYRIGDCSWSWGQERTYGAGEVYRIQRRAFHTTRISECAVTLVHRHNFDDRPARVLGMSNADDHSGICRDTSPQLMEEVLKEADVLLRSTIGRA